MDGSLHIGLHTRQNVTGDIVGFDDIAVEHVRPVERLRLGRNLSPTGNRIDGNHWCSVSEREDDAVQTRRDNHIYTFYEFLELRETLRSGLIVLKQSIQFDPRRLIP